MAVLIACSREPDTFLIIRVAISVFSPKVKHSIAVFVVPSIIPRATRGLKLSSISSRVFCKIFVTRNPYSDTFSFGFCLTRANPSELVVDSD